MRHEVHTATGLLVGVMQVASPNQDERPSGTAVDLIVLHGISLPPGEFGGPWIDRLFTGSLPAAAHPYFAQVAGARVSAHVLVRRDGTPVQYVPFGARAWHAGVSQHEGRSACNDFSIGIELEGTDEVPYEAAQYATTGSGDQGAAARVSASLRIPDCRPQRHRTRPQDRSGSRVRLG